MGRYGLGMGSRCRLGRGIRVGSVNVWAILEVEMWIGTVVCIGGEGAYWTTKLQQWLSQPYHDLLLPMNLPYSCHQVYEHVLPSPTHNMIYEQGCRKSVLLPLSGWITKKSTYSPLERGI
jgi:hypothetical protein